MNVFDDMDEAAVIASREFRDDRVNISVIATVVNGKYTPQWECTTYSNRTKYTTIRGEGNSMVEAMNNLVVAVKAFEMASAVQSKVTHVERNVLQLAAPVPDVADEIEAAVFTPLDF